MKNLYLKITDLITYADNTIQITESSFIRLCKLAEKKFNLSIHIEKK